MQPGDLAVDVEALRGVGQTVARAAASLRQAADAAGSGLAPPPGAGSAAGASAQRAEEVWLATLRGLAGRVDGYGTELTTAARDYRATDQENADDLRRSGAGVPR